MIAARGVLTGMDDQRVSEFVERLLTEVSSVIDKPTAAAPTKAQAREQAAAIADAAARLLRALNGGAAITGSLPLVGRVVRQRTGSKREGITDEDLHRLPDLLGGLRADALAIVGATDGTQDLQLDLPGRGDRPNLTPRRVSSVVLWALHAAGAKIKADNTSTAVELVAQVFVAIGIEGDALHQVREWLERHPLAADGKGRLAEQAGVTRDAAS